MTVYVVQPTFKKVGERLVPKHDVSAAKEFGEIRYLLTDTTSPFQPELVLPIMREKLVDFNDRDHLLLLGNPVLLGWAVAVAAWYNGKVSCLQWHGRSGKYLRVMANVFPTEGR